MSPKRRSRNPKFHAKIRIPEKDRLDFFQIHLHFPNISQSSHKPELESKQPHWMPTWGGSYQNLHQTLRHKFVYFSIPAPWKTTSSFKTATHLNAKQNGSTVRSTKSSFPSKPSSKVSFKSRLQNPHTGDKNKNGKLVSFWRDEVQLKSARIVDFNPPWVLQRETRKWEGRRRWVFSWWVKAYGIGRSWSFLLPLLTLLFPFLSLPKTFITCELHSPGDKPGLCDHDICPL